MVMIMVMIMIMVYVWKPSVWICVIFQKATQRPSIQSTNNIVRTGTAVVSAITSVYFFFHSSFPCTIVMYFVAEKQNRTKRFEELDHDQDSRE